MKCFGEVAHEICIITYFIEIGMNQSTTKSHLQNWKFCSNQFNSHTRFYVMFKDNDQTINNNHNLEIYHYVSKLDINHVYL